MPVPKGKRYGGKPKGYKAPQTIGKELARAAVSAQIIARLGPMTERQMDHAEGVSYMILRNPDGTFTRATDEKQIDAACAIGASAFKIFTQAPNPQAYSTLMAYAVDRPKEQPQDLKVTGTINVADVLKQRQARRKKAE